MGPVGSNFTSPFQNYPPVSALWGCPFGGISQGIERPAEMQLLSSPWSPVHFEKLRCLSGQIAIVGAHVQVQGVVVLEKND